MLADARNWICDLFISLFVPFILQFFLSHYTFEVSGLVSVVFSSVFDKISRTHTTARASSVGEIRIIHWKKWSILAATTDKDVSCPYSHLEIYINVTKYRITRLFAADSRRLFFMEMRAHTYTRARCIYQHNYRAFPVRVINGERFKRFIIAADSVRGSVQNLFPRNCYRYISSGARMNRAIPRVRSKSSIEITSNVI